MEVVVVGIISVVVAKIRHRWVVGECLDLDSQHLFLSFISSITTTTAILASPTIASTPLSSHSHLVPSSCQHSSVCSLCSLSPPSWTWVSVASPVAAITATTFDTINTASVATLHSVPTTHHLHHHTLITIIACAGIAAITDQSVVNHHHLRCHEHHLGYHEFNGKCPLLSFHHYGCHAHFLYLNGVAVISLVIPLWAP